MVNAAVVPTVIMHGLEQTMTMYTENGLDTITMIAMDSPQLVVTSGEWYASDVFTQTRHNLRHTCDISDAVDCNAVIRNDLIFRRLCLPPEYASDGRDGMYDCAMADSGAVEMDDLIFRQLSFPPDEFAAGGDTAADACDVMKIGDRIFRRTNLPPDEFAAWQNDDYIWRDLWTEQSVYNRPVTGSHVFGSSHRLERSVAGNSSAWRPPESVAC